MVASSLCCLVHRHIPGFPGVAGESGGGRGRACGFSSCSFCVPLPPWGRSIWGCLQCQAGPAAASGSPRRWCSGGSGSGCRDGMPRPFPAPGRRPVPPTAAAPETWRGSGSEGGSWEGRAGQSISVLWQFAARIAELRGPVGPGPYLLLNIKYVNEKWINDY